MSRGLERERPLGWHAIQTVDGQPGIEVARPRVSVDGFRAIRARAVPKIPVILDCRNSIGSGLRRENDSFPSSRRREILSRDRWRSLSDAAIDDLDHPNRLWRLVFDPYRASIERNRCTRFFFCGEHIGCHKRMAGGEAQVCKLQRV